MSLLLYSKIPGTQVKRDVNLSNATIQCDPTLLFPQGATQGGVLLNKENLAGKIAVEHDICNLDVNNLTVNGVLKAKGPAEICDIVCPDDFNLTAGSAASLPRGNVNITAHNNINLLADGPGFGDITLSTVGSADGDIIATADGDISMFTTSTVVGQGNINLDSSEVLNLNSQLISVLSTGTSTENVDLGSATVANIAINTNEMSLQDDSSKNISLNTGTLSQSENKDSIVLNAGSSVDLSTTSRSLILAAGAQTLSANYTDSVAISAAAVVDVTGLNGIRLQTGGASSDGISLRFSNTVTTDNLKMTQVDTFAIATGAGNVQQATANGVNGKITLLATTTIAAGANIGVVLQNTKIGADSVVLYTLDVDNADPGGIAEPIVAQGIGNPVAGSHELSLRNVGTGPYASAATQRIVINYLVINPV